MARGAWGYVEVTLRIWEGESDPGAAGGEPARLRHSIDFRQDWDAGTGVDQIDRVWSTDELSDSPTSIDLVSASSLPSKLDNADNVQFTGGVVVIAAQNESATDPIVVGGGTNGFAGLAAFQGTEGEGEVTIPPRGLLLWVAPDGAAPTAGTGDILKAVFGGTGTSPAKLVIAGTSA